MNIHEFGADKNKIIVLIHPSLVMWDYFEYILSILKEEYHIIVPALPGYDEENPNENFTSVEEIADNLLGWLKEHKIEKVDLLYGCSMGGSIALKMFSNHGIKIRNIICDGAITPYQLPWIVTRMIAIRDFLMISIGKIEGLKLLEKSFSTDEYSEEELKYVAKVLNFISYKTIWRTFESCNNYVMPKNVSEHSGRIQYWYGDKESKARAWDIKYMKTYFPNTEFIKFENMGHGSMASLYPVKMANQFRDLMEVKK